MKKITISHVTKVEGHASLTLKIRKDRVEKCQLEAIEGARFFEGLLEGRPCIEAHEITSRICGICSSSHAVCSLMAVENALKVRVSKQTKLLRELLLIGERIRSHATHLYFFVLPDYMGYESAIEMASSNRKKIDDALALITLGNRIVEIVGGREIHPFTCVLGGFTNVPKKEEFDTLLEQLKKSRGVAAETAGLFEDLHYPEFERNREHLCLKEKSKYPSMGGRIYSDRGFNVRQGDYHKYLEEYIEPYATAKFAVKKGKEYSVGALARMDDCYKLLSDGAKKLNKKIKISSDNPFHNNFAQALEIMHWIETAIGILQKNKFKKEEIKDIKIRKGRGIAVIEAPRGMLFYDYHIGKDGNITKANIITPTCQNLRSMELDIKAYVEVLLKEKAGKEKLVLEIEKLIRAHDPCFSCSTHFLKVKWL